MENVAFFFHSLDPKAKLTSFVPHDPDASEREIELCGLARPPTRPPVKR